MLTVLLATRDRVRILRDVLESYCALQAPAGHWKLVVVNNGSRDDTVPMLSSYASRLPLSIVQESRAGKNLALNTGLSHVAGDLIVLTDDDAFPRPDWLCRLRAAADDHGDHSVFGGTVLPRWSLPPEQWLLSWVPPGPTFSITEPSVPEGPTGPHNVFGPNMAIRASALADGTRFDEAIGPSQSAYAMGSETELVRRLLRGGHKAWFVRDAVVEHLIRESQMARPWILERAVRFGRGQFRLALKSGQVDPAAKTWIGVPRHLFRQAAGQAAAVARAFLTFDPEARFRAQWELNYIRGVMQEARAAQRPTTAN
jgi:glycosyltransferase involved in cell wall biosynthesis